jgi:hypothetical protein
LVQHAVSRQGTRVWDHWNSPLLIHLWRSRLPTRGARSAGVVPKGDVVHGRSRPGGGPSGFVPLCVEGYGNLTVGPASATQLDDASYCLLLSLRRLARCLASGRRRQRACLVYPSRPGSRSRREADRRAAQGDDAGDLRSETDRTSRRPARSGRPQEPGQKARGRARGDPDDTHPPRRARRDESANACLYAERRRRG